MLNNKMEETFTHIRNYWKEEEYKKCELEWKQIQTFISKENTPYQCCKCNTYWKQITFIFINDHENICPNCDTHCQPFLCNPINYDLVLKYIDPKYHHYLINDYLNENPIYKKTSHFANMLENTKDIETHKYTEEQYNADFKKLFEDVNKMKNILKDKLIILKICTYFQKIK